MFDDDISELMLRIEALESRLDQLETLLQKKLADVPSAPRQSKTREKQPVFEIGLAKKVTFEKRRSYDSPSK